MNSILYTRSSLQSLATGIAIVSKAPAFTSTVAFPPSCTCPDATTVRENGTCH